MRKDKHLAEKIIRFGWDALAYLREKEKLLTPLYQKSSLPNVSVEITPFSKDRDRYWINFPSTGNMRTVYKFGVQELDDINVRGATAIGAGFDCEGDRREKDFVLRIGEDILSWPNGKDDDVNLANFKDRVDRAIQDVIGPEAVAERKDRDEYYDVIHQYLEENRNARSSNN